MTARGAQPGSPAMFSETAPRRPRATRSYLWIALGLAIGVPSGVAVFAMMRSAPSAAPTSMTEGATPAMKITIESSSVLTPVTKAEPLPSLPPAVDPVSPRWVDSSTSTPHRRRERPAAKDPAESEPTRAAQATTAVALPAQPERVDVQGAINELLPLLASCAGTAHGDVRLNVHVGPTGQVRLAEVRGSLEGRPEGSCMARAARTITLPEFTAESFEFSFPYQF